MAQASLRDSDRSSTCIPSDKSLGYSRAVPTARTVLYASKPSVKVVIGSSED